MFVSVSVSMLLFVCAFHFVQSLHSYFPTNLDEVPFEKGAVIECSGESDDGWLWGEHRGRAGLIPAVSDFAQTPNTNPEPYALHNRSSISTMTHCMQSLMLNEASCIALLPENV